MSYHREEKPRAETSTDILKRALEICPQLATPPGQAPLSNLSSLVKGEVVGFRPTRTAGIRLEADTRPLKRSIPAIHNYGHGGKSFDSKERCSYLSVHVFQAMVGKAVGHRLRRRRGWWASKSVVIRWVSVQDCSLDGVGTQYSATLCRPATSPSQLLSLPFRENTGVDVPLRLRPV